MAGDGGGAEGRGAMMPVGASIEMSNWELFGALAGILSALLGHHFLLRRYIREQAGVRDVQTTEIGGQPIEVRQAQEYVTEARHREMCAAKERRIQALEERLEGLMRRWEEDKAEMMGAWEERLRLVQQEIANLRGEVAGAPARTVAMLRDMVGLLGERGGRKGGAL